MFPASQVNFTGKTIPVPASGTKLTGHVPEGFGTFCDTAFSRLANSGSTVTEIHFSLDEANTCSEAYFLSVQTDVITVEASSERGLFYGLQSIFRLAESGSLPEGSFSAAPTVPVRGIKVYLPEPTETFIREWKNMVSIAARYHFNTIMIELGGAMEYKSHPEINEGWLEYAAFMNEYPGKANEIQTKFSWHKNSIHAANGRGKVLSQDLIRELIDCCKEHYIDIIPEMPTLSHCDYLLTRHPELSERKDDPYPDTCCPSEPAYYQLIFDLFDEVIEVFHPAVINIGHDEYYTMRLCEKCKKRTAPEIYAEDILKIRDHLAEKGVKTMLWGEKLLNSHFLDGQAIGGSERTQPDGTILDATYPAIDLIPKDLEILHWYWSIDRRFEEEYVKRGFSFTFGNFSPAGMPEWSRRMTQPGARGYIISNWGDADFRTLQRNGIWFDMAYAFLLSWNPAVGGERHREVVKFVMADLYRMRKSLFPAGSKFVTLKHTTTQNIPYRCFVDGWFVDEKKYLLGHHIVRSSTGHEYALPVIFGQNISNEKVNAIRREDPCDICDNYQFSMQYAEVAAETLPAADANGITWYECSWLHPEPDSELTYVKFCPVNAFSGTVKMKDFKA